MPAALDGAVGKLQGVGCRVWSAHLCLRADAALGLKPMAQSDCKNSKKDVLTRAGGVNRVLRFTSCQKSRENMCLLNKITKIHLA
jgi:hypothetical protein